MIDKAGLCTTVPTHHSKHGLHFIGERIHVVVQPAAVLVREAHGLIVLADHSVDPRDRSIAEDVGALERVAARFERAARAMSGAAACSQFSAQRGRSASEAASLAMAPLPLPSPLPSPSPPPRCTPLAPRR